MPATPQQWDDYAQNFGADAAIRDLGPRPGFSGTAAPAGGGGGGAPATVVDAQHPPAGMTLQGPGLATSPNPNVPGGIIYYRFDPTAVAYENNKPVAAGWIPAAGLTQPPDTKVSVSTSTGSESIRVNKRTGQAYKMNSKTGNFERAPEFDETPESASATAKRPSTASALAGMAARPRTNFDTATGFTTQGGDGGPTTGDARGIWGDNSGAGVFKNTGEGTDTLGTIGPVPIVVGDLPETGGMRPIPTGKGNFEATGFTQNQDTGQVQSAGFGMNVDAINRARGYRPTGDAERDTQAAVASMTAESALAATSPDALAHLRAGNQAAAERLYAQEYHRAHPSVNMTLGASDSNASNAFGGDQNFSLEPDFFAAKGFAGITTQPTTIMASESGQPEAVSVTPLDQAHGFTMASPNTGWNANGQPNQYGSNGRPSNPVPYDWAGSVDPDNPTGIVRRRDPSIPGNRYEYDPTTDTLTGFTDYRAASDWPNQAAMNNFISRSRQQDEADLLDRYFAKASGRNDYTQMAELQRRRQASGGGGGGGGMPGAKVAGMLSPEGQKAMQVMMS